MTDLTGMKCEACRAGAPQVSEEELPGLLVQIPAWSIEICDEVMQLEKTFKFKTFAQALEFTDKVGHVAESEGHHPALLTEWGKVTLVTWWTHKIRGLHKNDFICAAKTDALFG